MLQYEIYSFMYKQNHDDKMSCLIVLHERRIMVSRYLIHSHEKEGQESTSIE